MGGKKNVLGFIKGKVIARTEEGNQCVVLAHRLGYEVTVPQSLGEGISIGENREFWLHTHVREDVLALYGFSTDAERQFFRVLLGVSGLGPKTALALIGQHGVARLVQLILEKKPLDISKAPGVGKKLAERIILELSGKVEKLSFLAHLKQPLARANALASGNKLRDDLSSALLNLGYPQHSVKGVLDALFTGVDFSEMEFETALKRTLKEIHTHRRNA